MTGMRPGICSTSITDESWRYGSLFTSDLLTFTPYSAQEVKRAHQPQKRLGQEKTGTAMPCPYVNSAIFLSRCARAASSDLR